jgi:hypothetical protein
MHENGLGGHEYWYATTSCDNLDSYTPDERGGVQGTDRVGLLLLLPLPTTMMVLPGGWLAAYLLLLAAYYYLLLLLLTLGTSYLFSNFVAFAMMNFFKCVEVVAFAMMNFF